MWVPDVYQGAPTAVTLVIAVSSKAAGFAVLLTLVLNVFAPLMDVLVPVLSVLAAATILFGNLSALSQRNAKRLMGLSGVSHAGYLLIGVIAALTVPAAASAVWFYLFTYLFASMAVFGVMAYLAGADDTAQELDHYAGLAKENPFLATILAVGLGSLAGIPPLPGFVVKFLVFRNVMAAGHPYYAVAGLVASYLGIYFYLRVIQYAFMSADAVSQPSNERTLALSASVLCLVPAILLTFFPGWLIDRL